MIKWILVGFVSLSIVLSISYVITRKDSDSEKMAKRIPLTMPSNSHTGEKSQYKKPNLKNLKHSSEKASKERTAWKVKEKSSESLRPEGYAKTERIVKGVDLSEDELKALHARQEREIELMSEDMGSIVISSAEDGSAGITLGELLALHEQQKHEIENADNWDEIVIPASENGDPGLSRGELATLQKQQNHELANRDDWDEIVIPVSENGDPGLSRDELATLQEQQNDEIWENSEKFYGSVAPSSDAGGPNLSVYELKELHKRQSLNK